MHRAVLAAILAVFMAASAIAAGLRVVDGDTIRLGAERVRIVGYGSPEMRGRWPAERRAARAATRALRQLLGDGRRVTLERVGIDRYGRTLARVRVGGVDVARAMIAARHGREYHGGPRGGWC